jgi:protoporphyrinogen oxidase
MTKQCATFPFVKRPVSFATQTVHDESVAIDVDLDVDVLVVGAGISGLGFVGFYKEACARAGHDPGRVLVLERDDDVGGYCRTVYRDGFVWDYSGHFFHFRHPDLLQRLARRMAPDALTTVVKRARVVDVDGCETSFPYQRALGELPPAAFRACLGDLWAAERARAEPTSTSPRPTSFKEQIAARLGTSICERFLFPYNEKLYACDLDRLDADCMGRFFPTTTFADVMDTIAGISPAVVGDGAYNATFSYPREGAIAYVRALQQDVAADELATGEVLIAIDRRQHVATTTRRRIRYRRLVTSAPLPATLRAADVAHDATAFSHSRVLVFNLGFDAKGRTDAHWVYFADRALPFYRVGYYDNILGDGRMSLYVEVGLPAHGPVDFDSLRSRVLDGLRSAGVVTSQRLLAEHHVLMDPAYVHLTARSNAIVAVARAQLAADGIHSIGRYGGWTYCSIEDNLVEARALADVLVGAPGRRAAPSVSPEPST